MTTLYRLDDIVRYFADETLQRGRVYQRDGHVEKVTVAIAGDMISGSVRGSKSRPYSQIISIDVVGKDRRIRIASSCSCPLGGGCKHVAAVLLEQLQRSDAQRATALVPVATKSAAHQPTVPVTPVLSLSPELLRWLDRAEAAAVGAARAPARAASELRQLIYVLKRRVGHAMPGGVGAVICPMFVRTRKDGSIVEQRPYDPDLATRHVSQTAKYLLPQDNHILRDLARLKHVNPAAFPDIVLTAQAFDLRVLTDALATGRVRWTSVTGTILGAGASRPAEVQWVTSSHGAQQLTLVPSATDAHSAPQAFDALLPLTPVHYVDLTAGLVGAIETALPAALASEVARTPTLSPQEAILMRALMLRRLAPTGPSADPDRTTRSDTAPREQALALPLPEVSSEVETRDVVPVPQLHLFLADARIKPAVSWYTADGRHRGVFQVPLARLAFRYDEHRIAHTDPASCLQEMDGDTLILMPRDAKAEAQAMALLAQRTLRTVGEAPFDVIKPVDGSLFMAPPGRHAMHELARMFDDKERYLSFSTECVPQLMAQGWEVTYSDDYPYRVAEGDVGWWADVGEGSGIDWFGFEVGIEFEGQRINLIPTLAEIIGSLAPAIVAHAHDTSSDEVWLELCRKLKFLHVLPDGRLLPLPGERLAPILRALIQLIGPRNQGLVNGRVKLHRMDAAALSAFADAAGDGMDWAAEAKRFIDLGARLRGLSTRPRPPIAPPDTFKASLRPYQLEGLQWLDFLRDSGFGGALADDMGLGKTVQTLAFLAREQAEGRLDGPVLIVAPTSVMPNWKSEAARFAPTLSVLPLHGPDRTQHFAAIKRHDVVLTTYPLLARDAATYLKIKFHAVILDEAQAIKNPRATITGIAHCLKATHRFALSGTPLENNLGEVWSLFHFLAPGLLGDESAFRRNFRNPIEKHGDMAAQAFLSRRLKPFMLRRTKDVVAKDLPPKTEIIEHVSLAGAQRDLYETVRALMDRKVRDAIDKKGLAKSHIIFLDALLKLRQVCCDPRLLQLPAARRVRTSAKLERLMEMIPEMVRNGRRILVFSQFTSMLDLIEEELRREGLKWVKIVGDTTDRETPVKQFQSGQVPLFLLSLKAGGTGLNLTAADTVIHYDPWWNPAVENQATDRAHRIGQDKPVFVHKLIVEEGIEQAIELLKARKAALAAALFAGDSSAPLNLTEADIHALLAPLSEIPEAIAA